MLLTTDIESPVTQSAKRETVGLPIAQLRKLRLVTITIRRIHVIVAVCVVVVGVGAFLAGESLSTTSNSRQPNDKAAAASTQTTASHRTTTTVAAPPTTSVSTTTVPPTSTTTLPLPLFVAGSWSGREPTTIDFSGGCCNVVDGLTWSSWTGAQAVGHGTWEYDTCASGCVNGPFDPYPATIVLSGPAGGDFTALTDTTTGPEGSVTNWSYPQQWPFSAS